MGRVPDRVRLTAVAAALAILTVTGCSWLRVKKAPAGPMDATPPVDCTSRVDEPVIDTIAAVLLVGVGILVIDSSKPKPCPTGELCLDFHGVGEVAGGVLAASGIPVLFSAGYGYVKTADCRELKEAQLQCASGVEASCRTLKERKP